MRWLPTIVAVAAVACTKSAPREATTRSEPSHVAAPEPTPVEPAPVEPAPVEPAPPEPPADQLASPPAAALEVSLGRGSCRVDADCVLSSFQAGCCTQACEPYATSKRDLAKREAAEACAKRPPRVCPPPAPCRRPTHDVVSAVCQAGQCASLRRPRSP